jgi:PAS domain-containing protein
LILARQLASYLATPIFIVDPAGTLLYFNQPAERILGLRFGDTGEMPADEWAGKFTPTDDAGRPIPPDQLPLRVAFTEQRPDHGTFWICGADGVRRRIEPTAFPLIGQDGRTLGALAVFWESRR